MTKDPHWKGLEAHPTAFSMQRNAKVSCDVLLTFRFRFRLMPGASTKSTAESTATETTSGRSSGAPALGSSSSEIAPHRCPAAKPRYDLRSMTSGGCVSIASGPHPRRTYRGIPSAKAPAKASPDASGDTAEIARSFGSSRPGAKVPVQTRTMLLKIPGSLARCSRSGPPALGSLLPTLRSPAIDVSVLAGKDVVFWPATVVPVRWSIRNLRRSLHILSRSCLWRPCITIQPRLWVGGLSRSLRIPAW